MPPNNQARSLGFAELLISVLFGMGIANLSTGFIDANLMETRLIGSIDRHLIKGVIQTSLVKTVADVEGSRILSFGAVLLMMVRFFHGNMRLIHDSVMPTQWDAVREFLLILTQGVLFAFLGTLAGAPVNYQLLIMTILTADFFLCFRRRPVRDLRILFPALALMVLVIAAAVFLRDHPLFGRYVEFLMYSALIAGVWVFFGGGGFGGLGWIGRAESPKGARDKALANWAGINVFSLVTLVPMLLARLDWPVFFYCALIMASVVDYVLSWNFYFPTSQSLGDAAPRDVPPLNPRV